MVTHTQGICWSVGGTHVLMRLQHVLLVFRCRVWIF